MSREEGLPGPGPQQGLRRGSGRRHSGCAAGGAIIVAASPARVAMPQVMLGAQRPRELEADVEADVEASLAGEEWGEQAETPARTSTSSSAEPSLADMESQRGSAAEIKSEPSLTDVESASAVDMETQSSSLDPLEDLDRAAAVAEQTLNLRWQCDLCFEHHPPQETLWRLGEDRCPHSLCHRCLLGSIRWGGRCPYDNTPIPPIVVCGAMGTEEYIYHEKCAEARRTGGIPCVVADCPGVASIVLPPRPRRRAARPVACNLCGVRLCGRPVCGAPWTDGHRCWDVIEEQRRRNEQELEQRTMYRSLDRQAINTKRRLAAAPRFRPCPRCGVMVEHGGGCNMVYHASCGTRWCFVCRRAGTCSDFDCRAGAIDRAPSSRTPSSGPSTPSLTPRGAQGAAPPQAPYGALKKCSSSTQGAVFMLFSMLVTFAGLVVFMGFGLLQMRGLPRSGFLGSPDTCLTPTCVSTQVPEVTPPHLDA